jgi:hypothetical protein
MLNIIGDGVAHFEPDKHGGLVWEIKDDMTSWFDLIESRQLKILSFTPPKGYSYLELFVSDRHNEILRNLGPNPLLQTSVASAQLGFFSAFLLLFRYREGSN